jgi:hypothetical protein
MVKNRFRQLAVAVALVAIVSAIVPAVGQAAGPGGTGPDDALAPGAGTQHLNVGQDLWYAFSTAGLDRNNNPSKVLVRMSVQPAGSATFFIWDRQRLAARAISTNPNQDDPPVGQGTILTTKDGDNTVARYNGDLIWTNAFQAPTTYYVQVRQTGSQPSDYTLSITGDAVSFPAAAAPVQLAASNPGQAAGATASSAPLILPATGNQPAAGSGPDTALPATGQPMTVKPGQQIWYKIQFPGTSDSTVHPVVFAELVGDPGTGINFDVWTAERLRARAVSDNPDKDAPPVGMGTVLNYKSGDKTLARYGGNLIWKGDAKDAGTYYFVVQTSGQTPVQYQLYTTLQQ